MAVLPTEVCENVIDMLYSCGPISDTATDITTLHSCALVCRDWRVRSQKMLFYHVQLGDTTSLYLLSKVLDDGPHLRDYVYEVELTGYYLHHTTSTFALFPTVFGRKLPNLLQIEVLHFEESPKILFLEEVRTKKHEYIPLHPRFPTFLHAFTTVSELYFDTTTFRTFNEFASMLHGLRNLHQLTCRFVSWLEPGGSNPSPVFTTKPEWVAGKGTLPPFGRKLRKLNLWDISIYGTTRLIWSRGPHLTYLSLTIPLEARDFDPKELVDGLELDLGSCTGLKMLELLITYQFSVDKHSQFVKKLLGSWKPQHFNQILQPSPEYESFTTRQDFAETLLGVGTIIEEWLHPLQEPTHARDAGHNRKMKRRVDVKFGDLEEEREWWLNRLSDSSRFPTFMKLVQLGKVQLVLRTPTHENQIWEREPSQEEAGAESQVQAVESSLLSKAAPSSQMTFTESA